MAILSGLIRRLPLPAEDAAKLVWASLLLLILVLGWLGISGVQAQVAVYAQQARTVLPQTLAPLMQPQADLRVLDARARQLLARRAFALTYINLRNADNVVLISAGNLEGLGAGLPRRFSRGLRAFLYRSLSSEQSIRLKPEAGGGAIGFGISLWASLLNTSVFMLACGLAALIGLVYLLLETPALLFAVDRRAAVRTGRAAQRPSAMQETGVSRPAAPPPDIATDKDIEPDLHLWFDGLGLAAIGVDRKGRLHSYNDAAAKLLDVDLRSAMGRDIDTIIGLVDDAGEHKPTLIKQCLGTPGAPRSEAGLLRLADGRRVPVELFAAASVERDGQPRGWLLLNTAGEQGARHIRTQTQAQVARTVLELGSQALLVTDSAGRISQASTAAAEILGVSHESLSGRALAELIPVPFADGTNLETVAARGEPVEARVKRRDGYRLPVRVQAQSLGESAGYCLLLSAAEGGGAGIGSMPPMLDADEQLGMLSYHDVLTGLPSRLMFMQRLQWLAGEPAGGEAAFGVIVLNIRQFHRLNLKLGYRLGDKVLNAVAVRIQETLPMADMVSRIAADHFAVLTARGTDSAAVGVMARKLGAAFNKPLRVDQLDLNIQVDLGFTAFPEDHGDADALLLHAEAAMYESRVRQGVAAAYDEGRQADGSDSAPNALHRALAADELRLTVAPVIAAESGALVLACMGISWHGAEVDEESPAPTMALMETASEAGLDQEISYWLLRQVCECLSVWRNLGIGSLPCLVTLLPSQLRVTGLARRLAEWLRRYRIPPGQIVLVMNQQQFATASADPQGCLGQLRELGLRLALVAADGDFDPLTVSHAGADVMITGERLSAGLPDDPAAAQAAKDAVARARTARVSLVGGDVRTAGQRSALVGVGFKYFSGPTVGAAEEATAFAARLGRTEIRPLQI